MYHVRLLVVVRGPHRSSYYTLIPVSAAAGDCEPSSPPGLVPDWVSTPSKALLPSTNCFKSVDSWTASRMQGVPHMTSNHMARHIKRTEQWK